MVCDILDDSLKRSERFDVVRERHHKAFLWEPQGWIPLGILVSPPEYFEGMRYNEVWQDPARLLDLQAKLLRASLQVGSDITPVIAINHMGDALVPSMFGAELYVPQDETQSLQNVGPTPRSFLKSIHDVDDLGLPAPSSGLMPMVESFVSYYRHNLPEWVHVVAPFRMGPMSMAVELRGGNFFLDLFDDPDRCRKLLNLCAEAVILAEKDLRQISAEPQDVHYSNFGIEPGAMRVNDDTLVNLSPREIAEWAVPPIVCVAAAFHSRAYVHFCSLDHSRHAHVYGGLAASDAIVGASSQFGFEYYAEHLDEIRGRLAIESFYGGAYSYVRERYGSFEAWAKEFVPRFKNQSGLILYFEVPSVEEGRELWAIWKEAHAM